MSEMNAFPASEDAMIPHTLVIETEEPIVPSTCPTTVFLSTLKTETPTASTTPSADSTSLASAQTTNELVVLIDPLSTGRMLQQRLVEAAYSIVLVWSDRTPSVSREKHCRQSGSGAFQAVIHHQGNISDTLDQIISATKGNSIAAVLCGSEYGVMLEDHVARGLNQRLGTTHLKPSGMANVQTKVDKHAQASTIRKAGLDAVNEVLAFSPADVEAFLQAQKDRGMDFSPVVAKPQTGAGSVGVTFCDSEQAVRDAYAAIREGEHKVNYANKYKHYEETGVLLQEYLTGTEYIVNMVVLNGLAKTTALWKYDKRPYNGAAFVCFSKELVVIGDEPQLVEICQYAEAVAQALEFQNGAIHAEIMYNPNRGPVLVEMNCRLHGGNAAWVHPAECCMGYSQLNVYMDAYLKEGQKDFGQIPVHPTTAHKRCQQVKMRTRVGGILESYDTAQMDRILALPSYYEHFFNVRPGETLFKTIDMPSVPGEVTLVHPDKEQLDKDYRELNEILHQGVFLVKS